MTESAGTMRGGHPPRREDHPVRLAAHGRQVAERWPDIWQALSGTEPARRIEPVEDTPEPTVAVDGIHLCSGYDRSGEADIQAARVPPRVAEAWVYGVGSGNLIRALLGRPRLRKLHVVILSLTVAKTSLARFDHDDWLSDPRVELSVAGSGDAVQFPFAACPPCLQLADDGAARLRDQILLELDTPYIRANLRERESVHRSQLADNERFLAHDGDVATLFGTRAGSVAVVAAAGPSLAEHYPWLRAQRGGLVLIATDAALRPLLAEGLKPDLVVCIDGAREGVLPHFDADLDALADRPLIYFPVVHPDVLSAWPGPRLAAYARHEIYREVRGRHPRGELFASGTVTHAAVDLAVGLGAREVHLAGADFGFPNGISHVSGSVHSAPVTDAPGIGPWVHDGYGRRIATQANLRGYLRDLEAYIGAHPEVAFVNRSRSGAYIAGARYPDGRP